MSSLESRPSSSPPARAFQLYPFQAEALAAIEAGESVLVSAPTGAGKTVIAEFAIERALADRARVVYTSPIKALSNQKFRDFRERYGDLIGLMTGDLTLNPDAPCLIMTTEIFRNTLLEDRGRFHDVAWVIMDEVHYLGDKDRGTVWEESILFAPPNVRFVGLSATIPNLEQLRGWISEIRGVPVHVVKTEDRPVPLRHQLWVPGHGVARITEYSKVVERAKSNLAKSRGRPTVDVLDHISQEDLLPCLYFCFSRRECEGRARTERRRRLLNREERAQILSHFDELCRRYDVPVQDSMADLRELAGQGILYHHAGMLPITKEIVERLFTTGLVKLLFATETFALGVNMPARSVIFSSLRKYDGVGFHYLGTLDYFQMAGRAGRQGLDDRGEVFSIADIREDTQRDLKEVVFGKVAPVKSRFDLSYSAVLNLYRTLGEGLYDAVAQSFATYQQGGDAEEQKRRVRRRIQILERQGFLSAKGLTGKGRIAAAIHGYEVQVAELYWDGCFEHLDPSESAALIVAIVHESRRPNAASESGGGSALGEVRTRSKKLVQAFRRTETSFGVEHGVKLPDFGLTQAVLAWAQGMPFDRVERMAPVQGGDLVRNLRMSLQMLRQFAEAVKEDEGMASKLEIAIERIDRDEVDAERQMNLG